MAKFLAELLGCTLPDKGNPPLFECRSQPPLGLRPSSKQRTTIFGALTNERALFDSRRVGPEAEEFSPSEARSSSSISSPLLGTWTRSKPTALPLGSSSVCALRYKTGSGTGNNNVL